VNNDNKVVILPISVNPERIKTQLTYHNIFRQLKHSRLKYDLSCNDLLVLNGVYLYSLLVKQDFTFNSIKDFVKYYNNKRNEFYLSKLIDRGYITLIRHVNTRNYYRLSLKGYEVINEMFNDYDLIHGKFINQFNISL
jgi:hypothetical protein